MICYTKAEFVRSAVSQKDFPQDQMGQIVFAGRSNVGKSSVINKIVNRKNFARVGNTPGKTCHINFFQIDQKVYFVDLPGYGFAKVSKEERLRWGRLIETYFALAPVAFGLLIVDIRHKPTKDDCVMANWFRQSKVPYLVLANKCDKISRAQAEQNIKDIKTTLGILENEIVLAFSAEKGTGLDALKQQLEKGLGFEG